MNRKAKFFLYFLLPLIFVFLFLSFIPYGKHPAIYMAVDKRPDYFDEGRDWVSSEHLNTSNAELFLVFDNRLYLRTQVDDSTFLIMVNKTEAWNVERLQELKNKHRELDSYWPNINSLNLGVEWVEK